MAEPPEAYWRLIVMSGLTAAGGGVGRLPVELT
jgi:hypothetical protein